MSVNLFPILLETNRIFIVIGFVSEKLNDVYWATRKTPLLGAIVNVFNNLLMSVREYRKAYLNARFMKITKRNWAEYVLFDILDNMNKGYHDGGKGDKIAVKLIHIVRFWSGFKQTILANMRTQSINEMKDKFAKLLSSSSDGTQGYGVYDVRRQLAPISYDLHVMMLFGFGTDFWTPRKIGFLEYSDIADSVNTPVTVASFLADNPGLDMSHVRTDMLTGFCWS